MGCYQNSLRCLLVQQIAEQIHERRFIQRLPKRRWHQRDRRDLRLLDVLLRDAMFFASGIGEQMDLTEFGFQEAGEGAAVLHRQRVDMEVRIDVTVRVEDVLAESLRAACADAVELRADEAALALDLMAGGAVHLEDVGPDFEVRLGFGKGSDAAGKELVELLSLLG